MGNGVGYLPRVFLVKCMKRNGLLMYHSLSGSTELSVNQSVLFSYFRPLMKQKLEQGINLVVDRYAFSGVAFTSAKPVSATVAPIQGKHIVFIYKVCSCTLPFKRLGSIRFE